MNAYEQTWVASANRNETFNGALSCLLTVFCARYDYQYAFSVAAVYLAFSLLSIYLTPLAIESQVNRASKPEMHRMYTKATQAVRNVQLYLGLVTLGVLSYEVWA